MEVVWMRYEPAGPARTGWEIGVGRCETGSAICAKLCARRVVPLDVWSDGGPAEIAVGWVAAGWEGLENTGVMGRDELENVQTG
jgi:hypothetical protein